MVETIARLREQQTATQPILDSIHAEQQRATIALRDLEDLRRRFRPRPRASTTAANVAIGALLAILAAAPRSPRAGGSFGAGGFRTGGGF